MRDLVAGEGGSVAVFGLIGLHVRPAGTVSVRVTVPEKPFRALTVIVEIAEEPGTTGGGEVADTVKSVGADGVMVVELIAPSRLK